MLHHMTFTNTDPVCIGPWGNQEREVSTCKAPRNGDFLKGLYNIHHVKVPALAMTRGSLFQTLVVIDRSRAFSAFSGCVFDTRVLLVY